MLQGVKALVRSSQTPQVIAMRILKNILSMVWALGLTAAGLLLGAVTGYASGGWVGAVVMGFAGAFVGAAIAAAGWVSLALLLP